MNKKIIVIIILVIGIIGILFGMTLLKDKKTSKDDMSTFSKRMNIYSQKNILNKRIKKELQKMQIETNKVKIKGIDITNDNKLDLVVYASTKDKKALIILEESYDNKKLNKGSLIYNADEIKLVYAYSKKDDTNRWIIQTNDLNYSIKAGEKNPFELQESFNDNYYIITKEKLSKFVEYDIQTNSFDADKLEEISKTNKEIIKNKNLTQEDIKKEASK